MKESNVKITDSPNDYFPTAVQSVRRNWKKLLSNKKSIAATYLALKKANQHFKEDFTTCLRSRI